MGSICNYDSTRHRSLAATTQLQRLASLENDWLLSACSPKKYSRFTCSIKVLLDTRTKRLSNSPPSQGAVAYLSPLTHSPFSYHVHGEKISIDWCLYHSFSSLYVFLDYLVLHKHKCTLMATYSSSSQDLSFSSCFKLLSFLSISLTQFRLCCTLVCIQLFAFEFEKSGSL